MAEDKYDSQVSILIKKMIEEEFNTSHSINYDDNDISDIKNHLEDLGKSKQSSLHQCLRLPVHKRIAQPSFLPDEILPQEARTQVCLEIQQLELPKKTHTLQKE